MPRKLLIAFGYAVSFYPVSAQHYTALNGSPFAGALAVHNNPAAHSAFNQSWDLTLGGFNLFVQKNNTVKIPFNLLKLFDEETSVKVKEGIYSRYFREHNKVSLFNLIVRLKKNDYVAGGINSRSYTQIHTSPISYVDTISSSKGFMAMNQNLSPLNGSGITNNWVEGYVTYGRQLYSKGDFSLVGGLTVKLIRGSGGAYAQLQDAHITPFADGSANQFEVTSATATYAVSRNLERIDKNSPKDVIINELLSGTKPSFGFDVGFELIRTIPATRSGYYFYRDAAHYDFKLGISVTDIGTLRYPSGIMTGTARSIKSGVTGDVLDTKFNDIGYLEDFIDTVVTLFKVLIPASSHIVLPLPTKLTINADKYLTRDFYINTQLVIPIVGSKWNTTKNVTEITHLIVTPRWDTRLAGVYLPLMVTSMGQVMPGIAVRAGPIVAGIHDLTRLGKSNDLDRGGYYIALSFSPQLYSPKPNDCPSF